MQKSTRHFTPGGYALRIERSRTGRGLFAKQAIPKGACVIEYTGRPVTSAQMQANAGKYLFWTSRNTMIDGNIPGNTARFINHSCAPNCEIDLRWKRVFVFALRNIKAGEELTYDYGEEYFDMHIKPKGCRCRKCEQKRVR